MEEWKPIEEPTIPRAAWVVGGIVVLAGIGAGYYFYFRDQAPPPPPVAKVEPAPAPLPAPAEEPKIRNPLPGDDDLAKAPLPLLDDSDAPLRESFGKLADAKTLDQYLVPEKLVRNIVVTVDNLARAKVAVERRPLKPTGGAFVVEGDGDTLTLSDKNFARYAPLVKLVQSTDTKQLAALYLHYYPLFQQSYEELGYPGDYFNDRLVDVIDHLLATPEPKGPIKLAQPRVFYEYADPQLEELSAGQKLLIRMGNKNAGEIKSKLRELRAQVAAQKPERAAAPAVAP
ncbi:MAG TPA: DUF3014 domain-containing protein [Steroidobacteraceae bacterium]|nr:DUF3014 domain-containing protein [Steroidobacteraceae bacterium]